MSGSGELQGFPQITAPISNPGGFINQVWYRLFISFFFQLKAVVQSGTINAFAMPTPPAGWLTCDGSAVSRKKYSTLFAAIGTNWGAGDGSTTFNLPPLTNRFLVGAGTLSFGSYTGSIPLTGGSGNGYAAIVWAIKV